MPIAAAPTSAAAQTPERSRDKSVTRDIDGTRLFATAAPCRSARGADGLLGTRVEFYAVPRHGSLGERRRSRGVQRESSVWGRGSVLFSKDAGAAKNTAASSAHSGETSADIGRTTDSQRSSRGPLVRPSGSNAQMWTWLRAIESYPPGPSTATRSTWTWTSRLTNSGGSISG